MISGKVISVNLLLATHASETLSRTERKLSINQQNIIARLEEAKDGMNSIRQDNERNWQERSDSVTKQLDQIAQDTTTAKRNMSTLAKEVTSISASVTTLCDLGTQVLAILRSFPAELRTLLQTVVQANTHMYAVLLELNRKIGAHPTLTLDSNIRVEDALGEVRSLPFEWFRHWEVSEAYVSTCQSLTFVDLRRPPSS